MSLYDMRFPIDPRPSSSPSPSPSPLARTTCGRPARQLKLLKASPVVLARARHPVTTRCASEDKTLYRRAQTMGSSTGMHETQCRDEPSLVPPSRRIHQAIHQINIERLSEPFKLDDALIPTRLWAHQRIYPGFPQREFWTPTDLENPRYQPLSSVAILGLLHSTPLCQTD